MSIDKDEFLECALKLITDDTLKKIETENYIFLRPNGIVTVKFKNMDGLTGYFTIDEMRNPETLSVILDTMKREMEKKIYE
jgi:hypothetical protein